LPEAFAVAPGTEHPGEAGVIADETFDQFSPDALAAFVRGNGHHQNLAVRRRLRQVCAFS